MGSIFPAMEGNAEKVLEEERVAGGDPLTLSLSLSIRGTSLAGEVGLLL